MSMIRNKLENDKKIITVWFDAWRYEKEQNLAVIPFLRTLKLTLDKVENSKDRQWKSVKKGVWRCLIAFLTSTTVTYGIKDVVSVETDLKKVADSLRGDGSIGKDNKSIYSDATEFLEKALKDSRNYDKSYRIVIFIDDLDRCYPEKALEVLESIKSFFDVEGFIYVIGMDSDRYIFSIRRKYGADSEYKRICIICKRLFNFHFRFQPGKR